MIEAAANNDNNNEFKPGKDEEIKKTIDVKVDRKAKTFTTPDGKTRSFYFELTEEQKKEISGMMKALRDKCDELCIPLIILVNEEHREEGNKFSSSMLLPGPRTPNMFAMIAKMMESNQLRENIEMLAAIAAMGGKKSK